MLSRACEYAIQATIYLAKKPEGEYTLIREISKELDIPHHYLGKIMQILVKNGILNSLKGPKGGLALSKKPSKMTMMDVITAVDGSDFSTKCIIGFKKCGATSKCPICETWTDKREKIEGFFPERSLAQRVEDSGIASPN